MSNDLFTINGKPYRLSESAKWTLGADAESTTLAFIQQWLGGQAQFELHTSGSTGTPKGILLGREQMKASAHMTARFLGLVQNDSALVCLNTAFIGGKMMIVRALEHGLKMTIVSPSNNPFYSLDGHWHFDFVALVPTQVQNILASGMADRLKGMKAIIVGGGAVSYALRQQIQKIESPVYSTYGMTETVSHIALQRLNGPKPEESYQVFEGIKISQDHRGCLQIESVLTQNQKLITNDLVDILSDNTFKWKGRADHVINSGGVKIHLEPLEAEIEKLFFELQIENPFFAAGLPDNYWGQKLVLMIEGELTKDQVEKLNSEMNRHLGKYNRPKEIIFCHHFVYTPTSKINRYATLQSAKV